MSGVPMLEVTDLSKNFRGLQAVSRVDFVVERGSITALIGPNGAGKTTIFNLLSGVHPPSSGRVVLDGQPITGLRPDQTCHAGIGRTFQVAKPFGDLSVRDNVAVGALKANRRVAQARREAEAILVLLGLAEQADKPAHSLTLPDRKRLEVAKALATRPKLLLLDEVMAGLRPSEIDQMVDMLRRLNADNGLTVLLIEHVMRAVMALSGSVVVLNYGKVIARGRPEQVVRDPQVLECYLGEEAI
jgi:branched-chain amino acid transport system ATP-binding protein